MVGAFRGMLFDEKVFKNAKEFNPERFIQNGKVVLPEEGYHPFSLGKHSCMGAQMAKINLFMFIAALLQNFTFIVEEGKPLPSTDIIDGITPNVIPHLTMIIPR